MTKWRARKPKWRWRDFLTEEEQRVLAKADAAKAVWKKLNQARAMITNRALQRAKYDAGAKTS